MQKEPPEVVEKPDADSKQKNASHHVNHLPLMGDVNHDGILSPAEDAALNVNLDFSAAQIGYVTANAAQLRQIGVDQLNVSGDGALSINVAQARALLGRDNHFSAQDDLRFTSASDVTINLRPGEVGAVLEHLGTELHELGVDHVHLQSGMVSDVNAQAMVKAGLDFVANDYVTVDISHAAGTHLSTSLQDLQKIGVDDVTVSGSAAAIGSLSVDFGAGASLGGGKLPIFGDSNHDGVLSHAEDAALNVNLTFNLDQIDDIIANAMRLRHAGIDQLSVNGGTLSIDLAQADALLGPDLHFSAKDDLYFTSASSITLDVGVTETGTMLHQAFDLHHLGVDDIHLESGVISDAGASTMVQSGLSFVPGDYVTLDVHHAAGTHLATSLEDLQKIGVDDVTVSGAAEKIASLSINLGSGHLSHNQNAGECGSSSLQNFNTLDHASQAQHAGIDMLSSFTTPGAKYGDLISALTVSGVTSTTPSYLISTPSSDALTSAIVVTQFDGNAQALHEVVTLLNELDKQEETAFVMDHSELADTASGAFVVSGYVSTLDVITVADTPDLSHIDLSEVVTQTIPVEVEIIGQSHGDELLDELNGTNKLS